MMQPKKFETTDGEITVDDMTTANDLSITVKPYLDNEGQWNYELPSVVIGLDNYQAYQLAMTLLAQIDVEETRGSR